MSTATGEQYELLHASAHSSSRAIIRQVAAGLRGLWFDGTEAVQSHPADVIPPMGAGLILVPWPNRVRDGRWSWRGTIQQLDLTDPGKGNATHGLLRNTAYEVRDRTPGAITLGAWIYPQHGYPFLLDTTVRYELNDNGLSVTHAIWNHGGDAAPVAIGAHPYLKVGDTPISDLIIDVRAARVAHAGDRGLPDPFRAVEPADDLRHGRRVGDLDLDACYGDLSVQDGLVVHTLTAPDGHQTQLWAEQDFAFAQVYTPRDFPGETGPIEAVAIEPMTAAPDALNSGDGLKWLDSGASWVTRWGIRQVRA